MDCKFTWYNLPNKIKEVIAPYSSQLSKDAKKITEFNPTIALPNSLIELYLNNNQMATSNYIDSEIWATAQPSFTFGCSINFSDNINSVNGTNLKTILESKNCTVIA